MNPLANLSTRVIAMIVGAIALLLVVGFTVRSCDKRRSEAAQSRLDRAQGDASANSAADAIGTVARSGEAAAASEDMTRSNSEEIRNAQGADARVGAGVNAAGLRSLCRRPAYSHSERCKLFNPPSE